MVAKVGDRTITARELREMIAGAGPQFVNALKSNPADALSGYFAAHDLAEHAEKLKLPEQMPWKQQIEFDRMRILASAALSYELNSVPVPEEEVQKRYDVEQSKFEQVSVHGIKIAFKADVKPAAGTSEGDLKAAAEGVLNAAHGPDRPEVKARMLADDIVRQARTGTDFKTLVEKYSEDEDTKKSGGDFGKIAAIGAYPDDLKKAALALKPGDVSEPVKLASPPAFYILKCDGRSVQPLQEVHDKVLVEIRQEHVNAYMQDVQKHATAIIADPDLVSKIGNGK